MSTVVQIRRGNTAQHSTFTGANAEITVDTDKHIVVVHDGATVGGFPLVGEKNPTFSGNATFSNATFTGNVAIANSLTVSSNSYFHASINANSNLIVNGHIDVGNTADFYSLATFHQNVQVNGHIDVANTADFYSVVHFYDVSTLYGNTLIDASLTVTNTTVIEKNLRLNNDGNYFLHVGNSTVNAIINSTSFTGSSATVGGNTASTLRGYSDTVGATAYSNAVSYVDTK